MKRKEILAKLLKSTRHEDLILVLAKIADPEHLPGCRWSDHPLDGCPRCPDSGAMASKALGFKPITHRSEKQDKKLALLKERP